ncbi:MAG: hypothetical protein ACLPV4_15140 [Solirubrobacteraceae bacterium]
MRLERVADLDVELADPGDDRLKGGDQRQHNLASGLGLELAGASLGAVAQAGEESRAGLRPVYPWRLRNAASRCSPSPRASTGVG